MMTISDKIFGLISENNISQKDFSIRTGIPQSTISDWKKKGTNPASDKIMIICDVLNVTPYFLLSGVDAAGERSSRPDYRIVGEGSEESELVETFLKLDDKSRQRVLGYAQAMLDEVDAGSN